MKRIQLCLAHFNGKEQDFIREAFDGDWVAPLGPNVEGFEQDLKHYVGGDHEVAALASGTAAIHLALLACGVTSGYDVIVQSFTFCASAHPALYLGARPVFVDSETDTWNMDPCLLEKAIVERLRMTGRLPKAIVPVTLYGMPYQVDRIMEIADRYGIPVVEDSAEALGSRFAGQQMGTFGRYGVLSFNGNKIITTSGGGALICPDVCSRQQIVKLATQARENRPYYQHEQLGYNYRLSNVCAGIGRGQMTLLEEHIARHREINRIYRADLSDIPGLEVKDNFSPRFESNFWLTTITLDSSIRIKGQEAVATIASQRDEVAPNPNIEALRQILDRANIDARPLWKPLHLQPLYRDYPAYLNPYRSFGMESPSVCELLFRVGLCLPSGPRVSDEEIAYIVEVIHDAIER